MGLEDWTYGTVAGVERLIGDIVANRTFTESTVPTLAQCEAELDNVAADINAALDVQGYTTPVAETQEHAFRYLRAGNEYGAAARLLGTIPTEAYDPDEQMTDLGTTRAQMYERYLNQLLKRIWDRKLNAPMAKGRFSRLKSGAQEKDPLYRRRMGEYPGARILPSAEDSETDEEDSE